MSQATPTARAWLRVAQALDERGSTQGAALRREVLALLGDAQGEGVLAELTRVCDARDELSALGEIDARLRASPRGSEAREVLAAAWGRRGDVAAVAALVRAAGGWLAQPVALRAGLAGLVARGAPDVLDDIEALLLPLARALRIAPGERWENAAHAARAAVHDETLIATTLALLGAEARARAIYEPLLATAPSRSLQPVDRAIRLVWCAVAAAAVGDPDARALLEEADACIDQVDDGEDLDGYTAKLRQRVADARVEVEHLTSMRSVPLGQRTLASASKHMPLPDSFRRFGEMDYAAERRTRLRVRIDGCAQIGLLGRALDVLAEAEADADVDLYQRSELVALAATALTPDEEPAQRERLALAASRIPDLPRGVQRDTARSSALAAVAKALVRAGHHAEALAAARRATAWHRRGALADIALALLGARRDAEARAVIDEIGPIDAQPTNDHDLYLAALVARARQITG